LVGKSLSSIALALTCNVLVSLVGRSPQETFSNILRPLAAAGIGGMIAAPLISLIYYGAVNMTGVTVNLMRDTLNFVRVGVQPLAHYLTLDTWVTNAGPYAAAGGH
jgi:uncharacterized protein (DUF697 family)